MRAQTQRIKTAMLGASAAASERIPSLVGQGDYGLIGNRMTNTLDTYNVGVFLSVPLFDGGQREGRIREARSQLRQETIRLDMVKQQVMMEVREALVTLASASAGGPERGGLGSGAISQFVGRDVPRADQCLVCRLAGSRKCR